MQWMTMSTDSRSSARTSSARSAGSRPELARDVGEATGPSHSGRDALRAITIPAQPGSSVTFSQPEMPLACWSRIARRGSRGRGARRPRRRSTARGSPAAGSSRASSRPRCTGTGRRRRRGRPARAPRAARPARGHAPDGPGAGLEVRDLEPRRAARELACGAGRGDRLVDRVEDAGRLVAHVGRVQRRRAGAAAATSAATSSGRAWTPGRVDQAARHPERAGVERLVDVGGPSRASSAGVGARSADPRTAARTVPWPTRNATLGPSGCGVDRVEEARERRPAGVEAQATRSRRSSIARAGAVERRVRVPAVARQLGREPLAQVAGEGAVEQDGPIRVPVGIDEPGRDDVPGRVDHGCHIGVRRPRQVADRGDPVSRRARRRPVAPRRRCRR